MSTENPGRDDMGRPRSWEPYADGTSGVGGSEASAEAEPSRRRVIDLVADYVAGTGYYGATWEQVAESLRMHHGAASGALSNAHRAGMLVRLTEQRKRCSVYVAPGFVGGRETAPYNRNKRLRVPTFDEFDAALEAWLDDVEATREGLYATLAALIDGSGGATPGKGREAQDDDGGDTLGVV